MRKTKYKNQKKDSEEHISEKKFGNRGTFLWFRKDSELSSGERDLIRKQLENLSDKEIIDLYYTMRDEKEKWEERNFYPNIKILYGTPFEREKDRREQRIWAEKSQGTDEVAQWYRDAREKTCVWWVENHIIARHSLHSCMSCGACSALCPAAELYEFSPRVIMETIQSKEEDAITELLKSDTIWYCHQCGSCKPKCPRENNPFGMVSSLRQLSQIKGYHVHSIRGRQQYVARHLWGGNLWNRACSLYFRNIEKDTHRDFGPRFEAYTRAREEFFAHVGACPDTDGILSGRKVHPDTLDEVRRLWQKGGALYMWDLIEEAAQKQAEQWGMTIDEYHDKVRSEG
ncbi:MAG TPA: 4Fe-4S dicluster domain-containing protein [Syntrophorhabdus sp.]|nr:4Fe-4S dicluster domain-containing protein [Syntrophorhabdus sp.]